MKIWKYHTSHSFKVGEDLVEMVSQVYQLGIYNCISANGKVIHQLNLTPGNMVAREKELIKLEEQKQISDLIFGLEISVTKDNKGLFKEIIDEL